MDGYIESKIEAQKNNRLGEEKLNNQGCLMKIVEYNNSSNIIVEFQDKHKTRMNTNYINFQYGNIKNPYHHSVFNIGMIGVKYPVSKNGKSTKEYQTWQGILERCFDDKYKSKHSSYKDVTCCEDWLYFENFYEWLHSQENFDKWLNGSRWAIDKDILVKGNKVYSPETCCLVPLNVNCLFVNNRSRRGNLPIGVLQSRKRFKSYCVNPFTHKEEYLGHYTDLEQAFYIGYKPYKENIIKQVAELEYSKGNITKECYEAMMKYEVEITD